MFPTSHPVDEQQPVQLPVPHEPVQVPLTHVADDEHVWHGPPLFPQALSDVPAWQLLPEQQPTQVVGPQAGVVQLPLLHVWLPPQVAQATPPLPQAESSLVPCKQVLP